MSERDYDREKARECYFAVGGIESDLGPTARDSEWYWRRAAKGWRDVAESLGRKFNRLEAAWRKRDAETPRLTHAPGCFALLPMAAEEKCSCGLRALLQELEAGRELARRIGAEDE